MPPNLCACLPAPINKQLFCATAVSEDIGRDKYVLKFLQDGNSLKSSKWEAKQNRNCATIFLIWKEEVLNSSCWVRNTLLDQVLALHLQSAVLGGRRYFQVTLGQNKSDCAGKKNKKNQNLSFWRCLPQHLWALFSEQTPRTLLRWGRKSPTSNP